MNIGGLVKCSLVDFPGKVCAVIFTQGCNFRCRYCHNPELVYPRMFSQKISLEYILEFLENRKSMLDAVVISGGEPTLQRDLLLFIKEIKRMGFLIKLDTNGSRPEILRDIFLNNLIDYIAMDIKGPFPKYDKVCGVKVDINDVKKSIRMIEQSGISYQLRTTYDTDLLVCEDLQEIRSFLYKPNSLVFQKCIKKSECA